MAVLALECSTSAAKAIVCGSDGSILSVRETPYAPGCCDVITQQPDGVVRHLMRCGREAVEAAARPIEAVALCGIWHSLLPLDHSDRPLTPIWTWANTWAGSTVRRYRTDPSLVRTLYERTGCMPHSMYGLWQWMHMRETLPEVAGKTVRLSGQHQYVYEYLTRRRAVSRCTASGSGLLNLETGRWDREALSLSGIREDMLPELVEMDGTAPLTKEAAAALGLTAGIPVAAGGADGALGHIGLSAMKPDRMTFSVGTSGALHIISSRPLLPHNPSTWCYWMLPGVYMAGAATSGAGSCISWFMEKVLSGGWSFERLEQAMEAVDRPEAPYLLPFHFGERCPGWKDDRRGGFVGLTGVHGVGDMYYALLEGILMNIYHCYRILTGLTGQPNKVLLTGGITKSEPWMRMAADLFGTPLHISEQQHASTMGAAAVALAVTGALASPSDYTASAARAIQPDPSRREFFNRRFSGYLHYYSLEGANP